MVCVGKFVCVCGDDYFGDQCQFEHACITKPCLNGGTCRQTLNAQYECSCVPLYSGINCGIYTPDPCAQRPCKHGDCIGLTDGTYRCSCDNGWGGDNCNEDVDECTYGICKNGGTCMDANGYYRCLCPSGYEGQHCEHDVSPKAEADGYYTDTYHEKQAATPVTWTEEGGEE